MSVLLLVRPRVTHVVHSTWLVQILDLPVPDISQDLPDLSQDL